MNYSHRRIFVAVCLVALLIASSFVRAAAQQSLTSSTQNKSAIPKLDDDAMRELVGLTGKRTRSLMVYLWYTACQPCDQRLADIDKLYLEFRNKGLDMALVAIEPMDEPEALSKYLKDHQIVTPTYLLNTFEDDLSNDVFLKDWEAIVPSVFFYDRKGHLVFSETKEARIDYAQLKPRVTAALSTIK